MLGSLLVGEGLSREACWTAGFLALCKYLPINKLVTPLSYILLPHSVVQYLQHMVSPSCRDKPLLGRQVITTGFWTCTMPRHGILGLLSLMHMPESWSISRGVKALLTHLLLAGDRGGCPGLALWKLWAVPFLQSVWQEKGLHGPWMVPSFQISALREGVGEEKLPLSSPLVFRMFSVLLLPQLEESFWVFGFSLHAQNSCIFFPKSTKLWNTSRNFSAYHDIGERKGQVFLSCEIISLNSDFLK